MRREILSAVSNTCKVPVLDLLGSGKRSDQIKARHLAAYFLRTEGKMSFPKVGAALGGRHHATIMHSMERIQLRPETFEPELSRLKAIFSVGIDAAA